MTDDATATKNETDEIIDALLATVDEIDKRLIEIRRKADELRKKNE